MQQLRVFFAIAITWGPNTSNTPNNTLVATEVIEGLVTAKQTDPKYHPSEDLLLCRTVDDGIKMVFIGCESGFAKDCRIQTCHNDNQQPLPMCDCLYRILH